ncbi:MAG: 16S rRNA (cytosine(967)-C(5))-methyltransferase RsmB [Clostridia bacterium]|nr:16S rRNA (cytosine(967)-C(5))-methyltransferase RsmB [Clostridia bacterium]
MPKINARSVATDILLSVLESKSYSNITVNKAFSKVDLSPSDKSLASAIVYGVLDRKITLDYIISKYVKIRVKKIKPITLNALRIALYQIIYMDKIPESAAVNESVNIVKNSKERFNASFVNGVLRSYLRNPLKLPTGDDIKSISIRYSCPLWIVESFINDYGTKTAINLLEQSLKKPPVVLRVNITKTTSEKLSEMLKIEGVKDISRTNEKAITVNSSINISDSEAYKNGYFHVEDMASQKVIDGIGLTEGQRVLDICSAPGGKAFTMAENMNNTGEIVACDLYEHRVKLIKDGALRLGLKGIKPTVNDAAVYNENLGKFDVVLCDVPCSGLGVIRRKPEIKYKDISKEELEELSKIQSQILENASKYVKAGGKLIYSTCTLRKAENQDIISAFLDKHKDFDVKSNGEYMPHIDGTDGFFCAELYKSR